MSKYIIAYIATAVIFLGLDFGWISQMGPILYTPDLAGVLAARPSLGPGVLFYVIYLGGVVYFCVAPALAAQSWRKAALNGAILGFCAYATYDLTNQATLRIWSSRVTVFDLTWGAFVTAVAASVGFVLTRLLVKTRGKSSSNKGAA